jgi:hypothetical protein
MSGNGVGQGWEDPLACVFAFRTQGSAGVSPALNGGQDARPPLSAESNNDAMRAAGLCGNLAAHCSSIARSIE